MDKHPIFVKASEPILKDIIRTLSQMFGEVIVESFFRDKVVYITRNVKRNEVFLVTRTLDHVVVDYLKGRIRREPYSLGIFLGQIIDGEYRVSIDIAEKLFLKARRNAIMINEHAASLFLYGRDVMLKSIIKVYPPLFKITVVINELEDVLGLCKLTVKPKDLLVESRSKNKIVCKNIIDKGWYLRKGH